MFRRVFLGGAVAIAALALLASQLTAPSVPLMETIRQGRNNTVLFLTNCEHGLSNAFVATAYTLLERHPEVEVHYASFPSIASKLERISERARQKQPSARGVVYHEIPDINFLVAVLRSSRAPRNVVHPPGRAGLDWITQDMPLYTSPWSGEDHMTLFHKFSDIIDEVDPSLVVLDAFLRPAIDAARNSSRLHAFISPLTPMEVFPLEQPYAGWLWKYPVMGSGIPYPVPWTKLLENLYINMRYFYAMLRMPHYTAVQKYLVSKGLTNRVSWFSLRNDAVPWLTQALPGASTPLDVLPRNVTLVGPIILSPAPAAEQDPDLAAWLARAPTVLVNLGSLVVWSDAQLDAMARAMADTLLARPDLQILWKFTKAPSQSGVEGAESSGDKFMTRLLPFVEKGRLKIQSWLEIQPVSLLETGHIIASVHHGGAGCYSEALGTGVPQIVLPQWLDHYSFAQLAQDIGVGVWGCRDASPFWTPDCLRDAFSTVLLRSESGDRIRKTARGFGEIVQRDPGQHVAAREVAKLAASGYGP